MDIIANVLVVGISVWVFLEVASSFQGGQNTIADCVRAVCVLAITFVCALLSISLMMPLYCEFSQYVVFAELLIMTCLFLHFLVLLHGVFFGDWGNDRLCYSFCTGLVTAIWFCVKDGTSTAIATEYIPISLSVLFLLGWWGWILKGKDIDWLDRMTVTLLFFSVICCSLIWSLVDNNVVLLYGAVNTGFFLYTQDLRHPDDWEHRQAEHPGPKVRMAWFIWMVLNMVSFYFWMAMRIAVTKLGGV